MPATPKPQVTLLTHGLYMLLGRVSAGPTAVTASYLVCGRKGSLEEHSAVRVSIPLRTPVQIFTQKSDARNCHFLVTRIKTKFTLIMIWADITD